MTPPLSPLAPLAPPAAADATLWKVYPKAGSMKVRCEFNRGSGSPPLGQAAYEPVHRVAFFKTMSRQV